MITISSVMTFIGACPEPAPRPVGCRLTFTDSLVLFRIGRRARALALTPVRNRKLQLHALQSPGLCEAVAATLFDDVGMSHDETLGRSLQHGVDGARDRGLIRNLLSDVGRYAQTLVAAGDARGTTPGPVVPGTSTEDDVCAQQGLRRSMIEHGLVEKRHAEKWQRLELGNLLAELSVADIAVESQSLVPAQRGRRSQHLCL